jgi:hypothetical protein
LLDPKEDAADANTIELRPLQQLWKLGDVDGDALRFIAGEVVWAWVPPTERNVV